MNFGASDDNNSVFKANTQPVFKAAAAVLPPPQPLGLGGLPGMPVPPMLGMGTMNSKTLPFERIDDVQPAPTKLMIETPRIQPEHFEAFEGDMKSALRFVSTEEPRDLFATVQTALENDASSDFFGLARGETTVMQGRFFSEFANGEYRVEIFALPDGPQRSYAEFNRFSGDGWAFVAFTQRILRELGDASATLPQIPFDTPNEHAFTQEEFDFLLEDIEEGYQDIAEHAAAELARQTQTDAGREMCDEIGGFCPRVFDVLKASTNCAIVRSLLICLTNMMLFDGVTKRIVEQNKSDLTGVMQKWRSPQEMCGGMFIIEPSQQVAKMANHLLVLAN